ncbi:MAG: FG-GAP-like repeat-containing protein [Bacteroidota bacterium]
MKRLVNITFFLALLLCGGNVFAQEICNNGVDDDLDGLIDCFDPDCGFTQSSTFIVTQFADDGEEEFGVTDILETGTPDLDWEDTKDVGVRFVNLNIPAGATITNVEITFTASSNQPGATDIDISAENNLLPLAFQAVNNNISNRPLTTATVNWAATGAWTGGMTYTTPDLTLIVQELVDQVAANNTLDAVAFIFGQAAGGKASAWAGEAGGATAPELLIEYVACFNEVCNNNIDDDGDGDIDCLDSDCGSMYSFNQPVNQTSDDAEEDGGLVDIFDVGPISDLDFRANKIAGTRFRGFAIPSGATITSAFIRFTASSDQPGAVDVGIRTELATNTATYQVVPGNISNRPTSTNEITWTTGVWADGNTYDSPDLSPIMQEVVDLLANGTDLTDINFLFDSAASGKVSAWAFEGGLAVAPRLFVTYAACGPEICDNGRDDDGDGLVDCYDPDCAASTNCSFYVEYECTQATPPDTVCIAEVIRGSGSYANRLSVMVADIDQDSTVELIGFNSAGTGIDIIDPSTMAVEQSFAAAFSNRSNTLCIAQMDGQGYLEIAYIRSDRRIEMFRHNGTIWETVTSNVNAFPNVAVVNNITGLGAADFNGDGRPEYYMANRIYSFAPNSACTGDCIQMIVNGDTVANGGSRGSADYATFSSVAIDILTSVDCGGDPECDGLELVAGNVVYSVDIVAQTMTARRNLNDAGVGTFDDGQSAVADINNDGVLDVVVHGAYTGAGASIPNPTGALYAWTPLTNTLLAGWNTVVQRGVPIIAQVYDDDLADDGDKSNNSTPNYSEIVLLTPNNMDCYNLNNPNNSIWNQPVVDPSGSTGITSFDFNGDGVDEITYRDEDNLRIMYGGPLAYAPTGANLTTRDYGSPIPCTSNTSNEYPVIADVDHDGEAEMVITCGTDVVVYESGCTPWLSARTIWNQFYYFGVNINDDGTVPQQQQSTLTELFPGTGYFPLNRTNFQISDYQFSNLIGVGPGGTNLVPAPDLSGAINAISNTTNCGTLGNQLVIDYEVSNFGDLNLPAGVHVAFYNGDPATGAATFIDDDILTQAIPQDSTYNFTAILPDQGGTFDLYMVINDDGSQGVPITQPFASQAECDYSNNYLQISDFCSNPLGVEWMSFDAVWPQGESVQLSWTVEESTEAWRYLVERSKDGKSFAELEIVEAYAVDAVASYELSDMSVDLNTRDRWYYRIILLEKDGSIHTSNTVHVKQGELQDRAWMEVITAAEQLEVRYLMTNARAYELEVSNHLGQIIYRAPLAGEREGSLQIPTQDWAKGMYFLHLKSDGPAAYERVLIR